MPFEYNIHNKIIIYRQKESIYIDFFLYLLYNEIDKIDFSKIDNTFCVVFHLFCVIVIINTGGENMKGTNKTIMECLKVISELKKEMPKMTVNKACEVAKQLIATLNISTYPIPIVKILNDLGFSVFASEVPPRISGFMIIDTTLKDKFGTDKIIAIDENDSLGRQRFTLAHEFAHFLFDFDENRNRDFISTFNINAADSESERIASRFAAEFLMPEEMFRARYNELSYLTNYERLNQLIDDFNVTSTSVKRRFSELGLE